MTLTDRKNYYISILWRNVMVGFSVNPTSERFSTVRGESWGFYGE